MLDVIALITALTPLITGLVSAVVGCITYLKTKQIHEVVTQQSQNAQKATDSK